jgi:hypothetical protein
LEEWILEEWIDMTADKDRVIEWNEESKLYGDIEDLKHKLRYKHQLDPELIYSPIQSAACINYWMDEFKLTQDALIQLQSALDAANTMKHSLINENNRLAIALAKAIATNSSGHT